MLGTLRLTPIGVAYIPKDIAERVKYRGSSGGGGGNNKRGGR